MKRSSLIGLRIENQLLDEFEKHIKPSENQDGKFNNMSECIRECAKIGSKLLDYKEMMKVPERAEEFQKKMQEIIQHDQVFEWSQALSDSQVNGFLMALQMEKETRYENKKLL